jgi:hypothetical protein
MKMIESEFKVLMYMGEYVNTILLENGIYGTTIPVLLDKDETIERLTEMVIKMRDMTGASFLSEKYIDNLKQCQLLKISIIISDY